MVNLPNLLTFSRLFSSLILPLLFGFCFPYNNFKINLLLALIFLLIALTDLFDGYLARQRNQVTEFGKIIDPIADKFLFFCCLIPLVYFQRFHYYVAVILIARELFVMGLREIALTKCFQISVSMSAKIKTTFQIILLTFIIAYPNIVLGKYFESVKIILIALTLFWSLYSALLYFQIFRKKFNFRFN
ncbi:CDP-diacylglycerol--glycerol-3-phosphate 3-phosphatidyltransferase [Candidatus Dependentiae bacterium]|nr:CDP-diacylglycerol--glycerol-3-phosphate 3-phosphatidyltransferase [Candidatus Dependentiae bacterium]